MILCSVRLTFYNLRADPVDAVKVGITGAAKWYIDPGIAFGWTSGTVTFQMVADAISHIMGKNNCKIFPYLDDLVIVSPRDNAEKKFYILVDLITELGLPMNQDKKTPLSKILICLSITFDIDSGTLSIDKHKLKDIYQECIQVSHKKFLSRRKFQSLLGKLLYIHKCVAPARIFINHILTLFREHSHRTHIKLTEDFYKDIQWFVTFLQAFNASLSSRKLRYKNLTPFTWMPLLLAWGLSGITGSTALQLLRSQILTSILFTWKCWTLS